MKQPGKGGAAPYEVDGLTPSSPADPRARLPESERQVTRTRLVNGTVLVSYDEAPLSALLEDAAESPEAPGLNWRADKPSPPKWERGERWERLR